MKSFKDLVNSDKKVFLNCSEFADEINVNGKVVTAILEDPEITEYKPSSEYGEGLQAVKKVLIVDSEEIETPNIAQLIYVNNICYHVTDIRGSGILHISVEESI